MPVTHRELKRCQAAFLDALHLETRLAPLLIIALCVPAAAQTQVIGTGSAGAPYSRTDEGKAYVRAEAEKQAQEDAVKSCGSDAVLIGVFTDQETYLCGQYYGAQATATFACEK